MGLRDEFEAQLKLTGQYLSRVSPYNLLAQFLYVVPFRNISDPLKYVLINY